MDKGRHLTEEELKAKIQPGSIISVYCDFIDPPHYKYHVVLYIDFEQEESLVFIVNSRIYSLTAKDPHLLSGQIELLKDPDYPFLDHNPYLDCTNLYAEMDWDMALQHLLDVPDDYAGDIRPKQVDEIIAYVKNAQTISNEDKGVIISSLNKKRTGN